MTSEQYYSKAIARAVDVLECFPDGQSTLSLKEISQLTELPESSLFRVLTTLEGRGYLQQNSDGSYRLAPKVLFGQLRERAERLREILHPHLQALARKFNETASLAYLFEDHIEVFDVVESFHEVRHTNKIGRVLPPHCSSLGKAITAFQDRSPMDRILEIYGLFRRTEHTIVDRQALQVEYERIRSLGYAFDREESAVGGVCIGAPVISPTGKVSAAISLSVPAIRMTKEREQAIIQALLETTRHVASTLR